MYRLNPATLDDADTLSALWVETFTQAYDGVHSPENLEAYCRANFTLEKARAALLDPYTTCFISSRDATPIGFYLLKQAPCPHPLSGPSAELKQIYILASEYGKGLGAQLFAHAMETLAVQSTDRVWLSVSDINHRALAFYKKLGFEAMGAGPTFEVGSDRLTSTVLVRRCVT